MMKLRKEAERQRRAKEAEKLREQETTREQKECRKKQNRAANAALKAAADNRKEAEIKARENAAIKPQAPTFFGYSQPGDSTLPTKTPPASPSPLTNRRG